MPLGEIRDWRGYRDLGDRSAVKGYSVSLSCHHCKVSWCGCAAESCCPECGAPKGYWPDDQDECYCEECKPQEPAGEQEDCHENP